MDEESSIYKTTEDEKDKEKEDIKDKEKIKYQTYFYPFHEKLNNINDLQTKIQNKYSDNNIQNNFKNTQSRLAQQPSKAQIYHYEKTIHDLSIKIEDLNSEIQKLNLQIDKSKAIIDGQKIEIKIMKEKLEKENNINQELSDKFLKGEEIIQELKDLNQKIVNNNKIKFETLNKEINEKEKIINSINQQIKAKDETIKYYTINNNLSQKYTNNFKEELEKEKKINKNLEQKIEQLNKQIDNLYVQNQSEGSLLLEIEHLKDDNIRLIQILKSMKQAEDLEILSTDTSSIKNIKIYEKNNKFNKNNNRNNILLNEAYCCGIKLKQKFGLDISNTILKNFVVELNRIWQDKYEKDIKEVKKNYQKELDSFHSQNKTQIINSVNSSNTVNNSSNIISSRYQIKNNNSNYIKNINNNNDYEKGCFWMIEKCDEEINDLDKNLKELFNEYEEKINNSLNGTNEDNFEYYFRTVNNCVKWFFSALNSMIKDTKNKINDWKNEIKKKCES